MSLPKTVALAVTSYYGPFYPDGAKTGLFYSEALHPYDYFVESGYKVIVVSEDGKTGIDEHSTSPDFLSAEELKKLNNPEFGLNKQLAAPKKASEINPKDIGIFFAAGGHGTVYDFPTASGLHKLAADVYQNGGIVSAVCHGPMILPGITVNGKPIIQGKKVTGFTDAGEEQMGLTETLKTKNLKTVKESVLAVGATYIPPPEGDWQDYAIADSKIVTGVNPQSALSTAKLAVKEFEN